MVEALVAIIAVAALAVAAWPAARALVAPAAFGAAGLSLALSVTALLGDGRVHCWWSLFESLALLALVFFALRRAPPRVGAVAALLAALAAVTIIPSHATATGSVVENAAAMAVWGFGALVAAAAARYLDALDERRARSVADARREQRLSLARDVHDFVAHEVSAMVVQAQAARVIGAREPRETMAALEGIEQAGLHALSAMDRAVEALRDATPAADTATPNDGRKPRRQDHRWADVRDVAARFQASGSSRVGVDIDIDDDEPMPPELADTATG
jgi:signal transduction histidine kinase